MCSFFVKGQSDNIAVELDSVKFTLEIIVFDAETGKKIDGANIKIVGTDGSSREFNSNTNGYFPFISLDSNTSYSIVVFRAKHLIGKGIETTVGLKQSEHFVHKYNLAPLIICSVPLFKQYFKQNESISYKADVGEWDVNDNQIPHKYYYELMVENPTLVIQIVGYQDISEIEKISAKRAQMYVDKLISLGIDSERLVAVDGGIRNYKEFSNYWNKENDQEKWSQENRIINFKVISTDFESN